MRDTPFGDQRSRFLAGRFGLAVFLTSLGVLFAAIIIGFIVVRWELASKSLWPTDLPPFPRTLWLSTATLILSSITMQSALNGIRHGDSDRLRAGLGLTLLLGVGFLLLQIRAWLTWLGPVSQRWSDSEGIRFALTGFYVLTGLHALHVIGGLAPMSVVTRRAFRGMYTMKEFSGVHYVTMYWHFLGVVWIVLLAMLLLAE